MAAWGQGDPRWIVDDLGDGGKNVNGWHWQEKNKFAWTKQRLGELLPGLEASLEEPAFVQRVTSVKSVSGEAMLTTRKGGKRFAYYDLKITLAWAAEPADGAAAAAEAAAEGAAAGEEPAAAAAASEAAPAVTGEISVGEFGSGSDHEDLELSFTATGGGAAEQAALKRLAQEALWPKVFAALEQLVEEMAQE